MGGYKGLNPEDMRELVALLKSKSNKIEEIAQTLGAKVKSTTWDGPDAEKFKGDWDGDLSARLKKVANALEQIGQTAQRELQEQTQTSAH